MNIGTNSSRRSFLVNGNKVTALPFLASLLPSSVRAAQEKRQSPKRLLWMSMGHGHLSEFYPEETGNLRDISMAPAFEPLKKNFGNFSMVSNLSNNENHESHNGTEALLSCANVNGFPGKSRHNSISCDQVFYSIVIMPIGVPVFIFKNMVMSMKRVCYFITLC